jgi:uncharacterized protein YlxW (UPF0749 family)
MSRSAVYLVLVTLLMVVLGITIAAQIRTQGRSHPLSQDRDEQTILLSELAEANLLLRGEIEALSVQQATHEGKETPAGLTELVAELNRVKVLNGMVAVTGPGVELLVDGPLTALDLQDLINELRNAGAEAIALNGNRLVVNSVVTVAGGGQIAVDGQPIDRPYRFEAIGDPDTIETALIRGGGLLSVFRRAHPNLVVRTQQPPRLALGLHRPHAALEYVRAVE